MPHLRTPSLVLVLSVGALLLSIATPTQAIVIDPADYTTEALPDTLDSFSIVRVASAGESIGIVGKYTATGNLVFFWKADTDTDWIAQNQDLAGADPNPTRISLAACGDGNYYVFGATGTDNVLYLSTDDGATWTNVETRTSTGLALDVACTTDGDVGLLYIEPGAGHVAFTRSADDGATWCTNDPIAVDDNRGSPSASGTDFIDTLGAGTGLNLHYDGVQWWAAFNGLTSGTNAAAQHILSSSSETGCGFWAIPYTTDGGTTMTSENGCSGSSVGFFSAGLFTDSALPAGSQLWAQISARRCPVFANAEIKSTYPITGEVWHTVNSDAGAGNLCTSEHPNFAPASSYVPGIVADGFLYTLSQQLSGPTTLRMSQWDGTTTDPSTVVGLPFPSATTACVHDVARTGTEMYIALVDGSTGQPKVISGPIPTPLIEGLSDRWCSDPTVLDFEGDGPDGAGDDNYGWNYVEQVAFEDPANGEAPIELADAYQFSSQSDNYAYAGKGWTHTGTEPNEIRSVFRIEADAEGRETHFRSIYSFIDGTPSSTTKGNGDDTGAFADHIAARFHEEGNDWRITLEYTIGGVGPTQMGSSVLGFNPNTPTTFSFIINTTAGYVAVLDSDGDDILNRTMNVGFLALKINDPVTSHWFITAGSNSLLNSFTFLDDNSDAGQTDDSTCLFFGQPVEITGDQGTTPGSEVPPGADDPETVCTTPLCVTEATVPEGFTVAALNGFLGILMVAGIAVGGTIGVYGEKPGAKVSGIVVGGFLFLGYLAAMYFGLLPLWPLVAVVVVAAGAVVLKLRSGA